MKGMEGERNQSEPISLNSPWHSCTSDAQNYHEQLKSLILSVNSGMSELICHWWNKAIWICKCIWMHKNSVSYFTISDSITSKRWAYVSSNGNWRHIMLTIMIASFRNLMSRPNHSILWNISFSFVLSVPHFFMSSTDDCGELHAKPSCLFPRSVLIG